MPICFRTPNCTFVNVGQSKYKSYRNPFHIGLLYYMYARIARATFHLTAQDNRSYPSLAS
jgi:hypothetical protein